MVELQHKKLKDLSKSLALAITMYYFYIEILVCMLAVNCGQHFSRRITIKSYYGREINNENYLFLIFCFLFRSPSGLIIIHNYVVTIIHF